jgi:hypothetical protein
LFYVWTENKKQDKLLLNKLYFNTTFVKVYNFDKGFLSSKLNTIKLKNIIMRKKIIIILIFLKSTFILSQTVAFDTTFGNNGKTHTGFGVSDAKAYVVVAQPDGKIIVGGSAYSANPKNLYKTDTNNAVLVRYRHSYLQLQYNL